LEYVHIISKNTFYDRIYLGILSQQTKQLLFSTLKFLKRKFTM